MIKALGTLLRIDDQELTSELEFLNLNIFPAIAMQFVFLKFQISGLQLLGYFAKAPTHDFFLSKIYKSFVAWLRSPC